MSFFLKSRKRKVSSKGSQKKGKISTGKVKVNLNGEVESESERESDTITNDCGTKVYSSEEEEETPQQKRLRLAKEHLSKLEEEEADKQTGVDDGKLDPVAERLQLDISQQAGKLVKIVADSCLCPSEKDLVQFRGHGRPVTAVVISPDDRFVFTASKDCNICKWNLETGLKVKTIKGGRKGTEDIHIGHTNHILCLAISSDGKFLAAGDMANMIKLWNPDNCNLIHTFKGHRDSVTGVSFRKGTHTLFSCSNDRVIKVWSCDELAYVETLFGHNSPITGIDSLSRDRAITSGGRDKSVHIWKIPEDSQLLFHGHSSTECVALINEVNFITGGDDNDLSLWGVLKKKPLFTLKNVHGVRAPIGDERWISSVAAFQYSDLVASGSKDGFVHFWKCGPDFKSLSPLFSVPVPGFVNSLQFSSDGDFLVAGVGQEHRLGRWWRIKDACNGWIKIPLKKKISFF